jgi:predicted RNase H-like HicB family nuclease
MKSYVALVHARERDVTISFPDLPECVSEGATIEAARASAAQALAVHLQGLIERGEAVPRPSSLLEIVSGPKWQATNVDAVILAVRPFARTKA